MSNTCEKCTKIFASKSSLNNHLKVSRTCGSSLPFCSYCEKKFTSKDNLKNHLSLCMTKIVSDGKEDIIKNYEQKLKTQGELYEQKLKKQEEVCEQKLKEKDNQLKTQEELHSKKIEDQDKYYDRLIVAEVVSKEKLRNEMRIKETIHKEQIEDLKKAIENLHTKIEKLVASKSASTVNNIINNGNVNLNTFITPEFVKAQTTEFLTYDHFANGVKGLANFVHDFILMDKNGKLVILTMKEIEQEEERKKPKIGDILYTDPKTGKTQTLFETLLPVFTVCCRYPDIVIGDKGCSVRINVAAENEEKAVLTALTNKAFTKHLRMIDFDMKCLSVYKPTGNYVIGQVNYHEGDERL